MRLRARIAAPLPPAVLALLAGFAAGRINLLDGLNPVAVPLFLVALCTDVLPPAPLAAGALLGTLTTAPEGGAFSAVLWRLVAEALGMLAVQMFVQHLGAAAIRRRLALFGVLCQLAGAWLLPLLVPTPEKPPAVAWAGMAVEGVLAALATSLLFGAAEALREGRQRSVPLVAAGILAVLGLHNLAVPFLGLRLDYLCAALVTLAAALGEGPGGGAVTGTSLGLALLAGYPPLGGGSSLAGLTAAAIAIAAAGLAAGSFRLLGRSAAVAGFVLAFSGAVFWSGVSDTGAQLTLLLPVLVAAAGTGILRCTDGWELAPAVAPTALAAAGAATPSGRIQRLAEVLAEAARAFERAAPARPVGPAQALGRPFEAVQQRVCQGCSLYRRCWETDFYRTVQTFEQVWTTIEEEGRLSPRQVPDELTHYCIYPGAVLATLNALQEFDALHRLWQRRQSEGRALVGAYIQGVAGILQQAAVELDSHDHPAEPPRLSIRHGLARMPGRGGLISGDSVLAEPLAGRGYLLVLSDGMGGGSGAARESRQAVTLLSRLLGSGFSTALAVQTINAALLLGAPQDSFATIDLALVDLVRGRVEFVKSGAVASIVRRGTDVTVVRGSAPPAGILHQVPVEPETRPVGPGDVLVMVTDGLWPRDTAGQESWLVEFLKRVRSHDPQEIADQILAQAVEVCDPQDDMTVLVACLDTETGSPRPRAGEVKLVRTAVPARRS